MPIPRERRDARGEWGGEQVWKSRGSWTALLLQRRCRTQRRRQHSRQPRSMPECVAANSVRRGTDKRARRARNRRLRERRGGTENEVAGCWPVSAGKEGWVSKAQKKAAQQSRA